MKRYLYKALNYQRKPIKGYVYADNEQAVYAFLKQRHLIPIKTYLEPQWLVWTQQKLRRYWPWPAFSHAERVAFLHELNLLLQAEYTVEEALAVVINEKHPKALKTILVEVYERLKHGASVHQAFSVEGKLFNREQLEMIGVGEKTGQLSQVFAHLNQGQIQARFRKFRLIFSLTVAIILMVFLVVLGDFVAMTYIISRLTYFWYNDDPIPWLSMGYFYFYKGDWHYLILSGIAFISAFIGLVIVLGHLGRVKVIWQNLMMKLPVYCHYYRASLFLTFVTRLLLLHKGGITLHRSMKIANKSLNNVVLKQQVDQAIDDHQAGQDLFKSLERCDLFLDSDLQLMKRAAQVDGMVSTLEQLKSYKVQKVNDAWDIFYAAFRLILLAIILAFALYTIAAIGLVLPWSMLT